MFKQSLRMLAFAALLAVLAPGLAAGQEPPLPAPPAAQPPAVPAVPQDAPAPVITKSVCGNELTTPAALPPDGSPPFVWILELCFDRQGGSSTVENETYLYYIKAQSLVSLPSQ